MTDPEQMREDADRLSGLYAGQCKPAVYEHLVKAGFLRFEYRGAMGLLGFATLVRVVVPVMTVALPPIITDQDAIWQARNILRNAYIALQRLRQSDPTIRCLVTDVDEMCRDLTIEHEACDPTFEPRLHLPFGVAGGVAGGR